MNVDYIIVGFGLAGLSFAEELIKNNKTFIVFENESQNSSKVAAGMFNPVVLKRFTAVWNGKEQLDYALPVFRELEKKLNNKYIHKIDIYRSFKSVEEQNNWFAACDKPVLSHYMTIPLVENDNNEVIAPFKFGKLTNTGKLDVNLLLKDYISNLEIENKIRKETFTYGDLIIEDNSVKYKDVTASKIIFCEGYGVKDNPFFNHLPMNEAKGELITIHAPKLKINYLLKSAVFVLPLGDDLYKVGATFDWVDKTQNPSGKGKLELKRKLETTINTPYTIVDHVAGIRPTIIDRRPMIGVHSKHKNLAILNGLGTRGVMIGPTMANKLYNHIENDLEIEIIIDIKRFVK